MVFFALGFCASEDPSLYTQTINIGILPSADFRSQTKAKKQFFSSDFFEIGY
jgi:hypothetical protein